SSGILHPLKRVQNDKGVCLLSLQLRCTATRIDSRLHCSFECSIVRLMAGNAVFCSRCGAANAGTAAFCQSCGAAMAPGAPIAAATTAAAVVYAQPATAVYNPYGGFWMRVVATLVDSVIIGVVTVPLALIFLLPAIMKLIQSAERNQPPPVELFFPFVF